MKTEVILKNDQKELVIREGKALEDKYPERIVITGNIDSISNFLKKRTGDRIGKELQLVDKDLAIITVDPEEMMISLELDPQNPFGTHVQASLEFSPELNEFKINTGQQFTREQLIKIIRFNRRFFDLGKHEELLNAYLKLNISAQTDLKVETDNRANKNLAFNKTVNSQSIPTEFVLNIPIFKGQPVERFRVEICLEATDNSVRFWFESVELAELIEQRKNELFKAELEPYNDFVIIYK